MNLLRKLISIDLIPQKIFDLGELPLNIQYKPEQYDSLVKYFLANYEQINTSIDQLDTSVGNKTVLKAIFTK